MRMAFYSIGRFQVDGFKRSSIYSIYIKSSSQSSVRAWLLDEAMFSSVNRSSYAWSFCHFFSFHSWACRWSSFFCSNRISQPNSSSQYGTPGESRCLSKAATLGCDAYLDLLHRLLPLAQLLQHVVPLGLEIGLFLDFCLVEAVDDGVLSVGDEDAPDLFVARS